jgi:uncharacterized membrane protein YfcA
LAFYRQQVDRAPRCDPPTRRPARAADGKFLYTARSRGDHGRRHGDFLGGELIWLAAYAVAGAIVGVLAGLLGIGGGMTLVPILSALFSAQALAPGYTVHLALGTAMASIVFTSSASVRAHHQRRAVDWRIVRQLAPGTVIGALLATLASGFVSQRALALSFAVIVYVGALQMLFGGRPSAARGLPAAPALLAIGIAIGIICGLVSAGGAFMTVPLMLYCGVPLVTAIGTAAAIGIPVAVVGTAGYIVSGSGAAGLPEATLGFVFLPALVALVVASSLTAPLGASLAHRLPVATLKRIFAVLLFALATRMIVVYA